MQEQLTLKMPELKKVKDEVEQMMVQIEQDKVGAGETMKMVEAQEADAQAKQEVCN
jgi:hypothetical protein